MKKSKRFIKQRMAAMIAAAICAAALSACGAGSTSSTTVSNRSGDRQATGEGLYMAKSAAEYDVAEEAVFDVEEAMELPETEELKRDTGRKLITTVRMSAETEDFDAFNATIERKTESLGGYVESVNIYNSRSRYAANGSEQERYADYTLRIPAKHLNAFLSEVQEHSNVLDRSKSVEDVTLTYVDIESRKKALETERDRLMELVAQADSVEDIIALEERISTVRYELERLESSLRSFDNQVDYSTVILSVQEVVRYTPVEEESALVRMRRGFADSVADVADGLKEFFVGFVIHIPQIIVFLLVAAVLILIVRGVINLMPDNEKRKARKEKRLARKQAKQNQAQESEKKDNV